MSAQFQNVSYNCLCDDSQIKVVKVMTRILFLPVDKTDEHHHVVVSYQGIRPDGRH